MQLHQTAESNPGTAANLATVIVSINVLFSEHCKLKVDPEVLYQDTLACSLFKLAQACSIETVHH